MLPLLVAAQIALSGSPDSLAAVAAVIDAGDPDHGLVLLDAYEAEGGHHHHEVIELLLLRATAQAFVEDDVAAQQTFRRLLTVAPAATLPYDASPKVTFAFEAARRAARNDRPLELAVVLPNAAGLEEPLPMVIRRVADGDRMIASIVVSSGRKGMPAQVQRLVFTGNDMRVTLPACPAIEASNDSQGRPGVLLEVMVTGLDRVGSEVFVWPAPQRPASLPVGFETPTPWYGNPWLWSGVVVAAAVAASGTAAAIVAAQQPPPRIPVVIEVKR